MSVAGVCGSLASRRSELWEQRAESGRAGRPGPMSGLGKSTFGRDLDPFINTITAFCSARRNPEPVWSSRRERLNGAVISIWFPRKTFLMTLRPPFEAIGAKNENHCRNNHHFIGRTRRRVRRFSSAFRPRRGRLKWSGGSSFS